MQFIKENIADRHIYRTLLKILNLMSRTEGTTKVSHIGSKQMKKRIDSTLLGNIVPVPASHF